MAGNTARQVSPTVTVLSPSVHVGKLTVSWHSMRAQGKMLLSVAAPCPHRSAAGLVRSPSEALTISDAPGGALKPEHVLDKTANVDTLNTETRTVHQVPKLLKIRFCLGSVLGSSVAPRP